METGRQKLESDSSELSKHEDDLFKSLSVPKKVSEVFNNQIQKGIICGTSLKKVKFTIRIKFCATSSFEVELASTLYVYLNKDHWYTDLPSNLEKKTVHQENPSESTLENK